MPRTATVFRDVVESATERLTLRLPKEFANRRLEVIVMPLDDLSEPAERVTREVRGWPPGYFDRLMGSVPDFPESELDDLLDDRDASVWDATEESRP